MSHVEPKILLHLPLILNYILLESYFFTLIGTQTRAYGSSIVLQLPLHLLTLTVIR